MKAIVQNLDPTSKDNTKIVSLKFTDLSIFIIKEEGKKKKTFLLEEWTVHLIPTSKVGSSPTPKDGHDPSAPEPALVKPSGSPGLVNWTGSS